MHHFLSVLSSKCQLCFDFFFSLCTHPLVFISIIEHSAHGLFQEFEQKLARLAAEEASGSALAQESASTLESNVGENINNVDKMIASEARSNPSSTPRFMNRSRVQPLTPIERKVARNAFNKWRKYEARSLADELVGAASLLKEANIYSVDLNKAAEFQFALRRLTEFTPGSSRRTQLMIEASYVLNACCCDIEATVSFFFKNVNFLETHII